MGGEIKDAPDGLVSLFFMAVNCDPSMTQLRPFGGMKPAFA
jgi:hypothetical protein